ncbi:MAG: hypothetical protein Kow0042_27000 [Calditrichia bacterium]
MIIESYLVNNTTSVLDLRIIILNATIPPGWSAAYCPPLACLPIDIDTSFVFSLNPSDTDTITVDFFPDTSSAVGYVTMKVENYNNPTEFYVKDFAASTGPTNLRSRPGYVASDFFLGSNYPNPFNPITTIPFVVGGIGYQPTKLTVYNLLGQQVRVLLNSSLKPGSYEVTWDGKDQFGKTMPSGLYFYELQSGQVKLMGKMVLLK